MDNNYYTEPNKPSPGFNYLVVFLNVFNKGGTRVWPPAPGSIQVHYNRVVYSSDPIHVLPDKASDRKAAAIEIKEVQYFSKFFGSGYGENYEYSYGIQYAYLNLGKSSAIDGYLIYRVPASLTLDKT